MPAIKDEKLLEQLTEEQQNIHIPNIVASNIAQQTQMYSQLQKKCMADYNFFRSELENTNESILKRPMVSIGTVMRKVRYYVIAVSAHTRFFNRVNDARDNNVLIDTLCQLAKNTNTKDVSAVSQIITKTKYLKRLQTLLLLNSTNFIDFMKGPKKTDSDTSNTDGSLSVITDETETTNDDSSLSTILHHIVVGTLLGRYVKVKRCIGIGVVLHVQKLDGSILVQWLNTSSYSWALPDDVTLENGTQPDTVNVSQFPLSGLFIFARRGVANRYGSGLNDAERKSYSLERMARYLNSGKIHLLTPSITHPVKGFPFTTARRHTNTTLRVGQRVERENPSFLRASSKKTSSPQKSSVQRRQNKTLLSKFPSLYGTIIGVSSAAAASHIGDVTAKTYAEFKIQWDKCNPINSSQHQGEESTLFLTKISLFNLFHWIRVFQILFYLIICFTQNLLIFPNKEIYRIIQLQMIGYQNMPKFFLYYLGVH